MTAGELIKKLQDLDEDLPVILSCDEEGNGFDSLVDVEQGFWSEEWASYTSELDDIDEENRNDYSQCCCLWP